jgi:ubiquinone/menaquinone biosynthesis C-methylase UbiE
MKLERELRVERILDLGCGTGGSGRAFGLDVEDWAITGLDVQSERTRIARRNNRDRGWNYVCARGEQTPFQSASFDGVFSEVALPYMQIPRTLAELHRVLVPGGWLRVTLHLPAFTWLEFLRAFPKPKQSLFRIFVLLNGVILHFTGRVMALGTVAESCQTEAGMRIALRRAGFENVTFRREGLRFFVEARRDGSVHELQEVEVEMSGRAGF